MYSGAAPEELPFCSDIKIVLKVVLIVIDVDEKYKYTITCREQIIIFYRRKIPVDKNLAGFPDEGLAVSAFIRRELQDNDSI